MNTLVNAINIIKVPGHPPNLSTNPPSGKFCFRHGTRLPEGTKQKYWQLITVAIIDMVMRKQGVEYSLMGTGDNQVIFISQRNTTVKSSIRDVANKALHNLRSAFLRYGMTLKAAESYFSRDYVEFNKIVFFGTFYPGKTARALAALVSKDRVVLPMPMSELSSLKSSLSNTITHEPSYYHLYIISLCILLSYYSQNFEIKNYDTIHDIVLIPSCMSGMPSLWIPELIIKGTYDFRARARDYIKRLICIRPSVKRILRCLKKWNKPGMVTRIPFLQIREEIEEFMMVTCLELMSGWLKNKIICDISIGKREEESIRQKIINK